MFARTRGLASACAYARSMRSTVLLTPRYTKKSLSSNSRPSVKLYQYAICPFCHKAKALLAYAKVPHEIVEVNPLTKRELGELPVDYRKVPIAIVDGQQVNGSNEIVKTLLEHPGITTSLGISGISPQDFQSSDSAKKWSDFAQNDLAALLYPTICLSLSDSRVAFGYVENVPTFSNLQKFLIRNVGSVAMYFAASKIKSKRGIVDVRDALDKALETWEEQGLENGKKEFASGLDGPNLGDVTVFGTLRSIEGLPAHDRILERPLLSQWYVRMRKRVYDNDKTYE